MKTQYNNKSGAKSWYIVIVSALIGCSLSAGFPQFSMTVAELSAKTGMSQAFLLSGDTVKSATIVISMLVSGAFYKKFGAKCCLLFSGLCAVLPQFVIPVTAAPAVFMVCKGIQGFASLIFPVFLVIIMDVIPEKQSGFATAVFNGIFYSGGGIGGTLSGVFISKWGWMSSYYAIGIIEALLITVGLITIRKTTGYSDNQKPQSDHNNQLESTTPAGLLKLPVVWLLIMAFVSTTFVVQAITVDFPLFSSYIGYGSTEVGIIGNAVSLGLIISCLISGKISDIMALRTDNKAFARVLALAIGPALIIVSALLIITIDLNSFGVYFFVAFLFSFGGSWGFGTFYAVLPEIFSTETLPHITGIAGGAADCGMPAAPLLVGVVFGSRGLWQSGWGVCIAIAILSFISCIVLCRWVTKNDEI